MPRNGLYLHASSTARISEADANMREAGSTGENRSSTASGREAKKKPRWLNPAVRHVSSLDAHLPLRERRKRAVFRARKVLEQLVHDDVRLEGNTFTLAEVKTLMAGVSVGGRSLEEHQQVLNQIGAYKMLFQQVEDEQFSCSSENLKTLHARLAFEEALEWGVFRSGPVRIGGTDHKPMHHSRIQDSFDQDMPRILEVEDAHVRAISIFLYVARNQLFWDGNKRTGRLAMNGILLTEGHDVIAVPKKRELEFNERMLEYYDTANPTRIISFMASCSLDETLRETQVEEGAGLTGA